MILNTSHPFGVIVLGPYRSGTSVTSQVLAALGVDFGEPDKMFAGDRRNPGGYFERADVNEANTRFIESAGFTLADPGEADALIARGDASILRGLDLSWKDKQALWGVKDPRLCAVLPAWIHEDLISKKSAAIVHVVRDLQATKRSVMEFPHVYAYAGLTPTGAARMVARYADLAERNAGASGLPIHRIIYEELLANPGEIIADLAKFLDIEDASRIASATRIIGKDKGLLKLYALDKPRRVLRRAGARLLRK